MWVFGSFPETYATTALFINLFLLNFLKDPQVSRPLRLAALNAAAGFVAPHQAMLAALPLVHLSATQGWRGGLRRAVRYAALVTVAFLLPYALGLAVLGHVDLPTIEAQRNLSPGHLLEPSSWLTIAACYLAFAVVSLGVPPNRYFPFGPETIAAAQPQLWLCLGVVLAYAIFGAVRSWRNWPFPGALALGLYCGLYVAFFACWSRADAFLFTAPAVLPSWLLFHGGHVPNQSNRLWKCLLAVACAGIVVVNGQFLLTLHKFDPLPERVERSVPESIENGPARISPMRGSSCWAMTAGIGSDGCRDRRIPARPGRESASARVSHAHRR